MAIVTISTSNDDEADIISNIVEGLGFPSEVEIQYDDDLKQGAHGLDYPLSNQSEISDLNC